MKKIILYIAASLDQRIAESDGSLDWLNEFPNPEKTDYGYKSLLTSVDTVIMGGRTYREILNMGVIWPYPEQMAYVIPHFQKIITFAVMLRRIYAFAVVFLFLFSCGNKKRTVEPAVVMEDTVDSVDFVEDTTFLIEPAEPSLTTAGDEIFDDFIYAFAGDTAFQRSRIVFPLSYYKGDTPLKIEKKEWIHDALFIKQNYYTLLSDTEEGLDHPHDNSQTSVQIEWTFMQTHIVKKYYFERIGGRWVLEAINERPIVKEKRAGFVDFFARFAADSLYQLKHIRRPLEFVTTDPDDDFSVIETTLDAEQWFAFKPILPDDKLSNIIYGQEPSDESPYKIVQLKGIGNGFLNTLFFRQKPNGKWELYKYEDTSN